MVAGARVGRPADVHTHTVTCEHICVIYGSTFSGKDTLNLVKMKKRKRKKKTLNQALCWNKKMDVLLC